MHRRKMMRSRSEVVHAGRSAIVCRLLTRVRHCLKPADSLSAPRATQEPPLDPLVSRRIRFETVMENYGTLRHSILTRNRYPRWPGQPCRNLRIRSWNKIRLRRGVTDMREMPDACASCSMPAACTPRSISTTRTLRIPRFPRHGSKDDPSETSPSALSGGYHPRSITSPMCAERLPFIARWSDSFTGGTHVSPIYHFAVCSDARTPNGSPE